MKKALNVLLLLIFCIISTMQIFATNLPTTFNNQTLITLADAKNIALKHSLLSEKEVNYFKKEKIDYETINNTRTCLYEIEFISNKGVEYQYKIDAINKNIYEFEKENKIYNTNGKAMDINACKKAILYIAKDLVENNINVYEDIDDRRSEFKSKIYNANTEYEFTFDKATSTLNKLKVKNNDGLISGSVENIIILKKSNDANATTSNNATSNNFSIDDAKQEALKKVPGANNSNIVIKEDYDDGIRVYEGKIIYNNKEYEFKFDKANGTLLKWEVESAYD
ncbi:MAG: PepSY domain-containing protein [Eubacteriales bacterium]|nr:PepSY domain-containing protein [Eubacteriales bacterium]